MKNFYKTTVMMMICFFIAHSAFADVTADFTADQTTIVAGTEIQFTDLSTGNPTNWEWDFENDGTIDSYVQNPAWIYEEPGLFTVSLTVSDGTVFDTETKTDYIDVRVYIPDEIFKAKINGYLGQPPAYNPTVADLNGITGYLVADNLNISYIEGAQYLTNLTGLILHWNQISDISAVSGLVNLASLDLRWNQISNISAVSDLVNLTMLEFGNNQISDISAVSGLTNLTTLFLYENQISDISAVSGLTNLTELWLLQNQIIDISSISGLVNLTVLVLGNNQISDISAVSGLTNLTRLSLCENQITNISAVSGLTNLAELYLYDNQISDISAVSGLTNLDKLYLYDNQISDIYYLIENNGLGLGDKLYLERWGYTNPLSQEALNVHIPILESRGFYILQYPTTPDNYAACYPDPSRNETGVYINADLEWQGNFQVRDIVYNVWLGETSDNLVNVGLGTAINDTLYSFTPNLEPTKDYYWKVRAITTNTADTVWSGLWHFTTCINADFSADQTTIAAYNTIQFTDLSTGNLTSWQWDFENDGTIDSYEQNPEWIYEEPGLFTVSLTVSDGTTSDTETKTDYIDVRVYIPDENFKEVINEYLGQPPAYNPTVPELHGITGTLYASYFYVSSIVGAHYLINLTELYLNDNQISDISAVSGLTNLTRLYLNDNQISDISAVSGLTNLTRLYLYENQISDISAVSGLTNLSELLLYDNQISDISAVSGLTNLSELLLYDNQISDISAVSGLTNLSELLLYDNQISDISAISGLTNLTELHLYDNQISDISAVSGLTNLTKFYLHDNQISDISAVSGLTNLTILYLNDNQISDISAVSGLTNLTRLYLYDNQISDIYPIVENTELGSGDILKLNSNPLSKEAINVHIPILESRGFYSLQFPSTPNNYAACYPDPARYEAVDYLNDDLEWQGNFPSRDAVYDVWLGETSDDLVNVGFSTTINDTLYSFTPDLNPDMDYWWKVRAITTTDTIWSGLWQFTTYITADFSAVQTSIIEGDTIHFIDLSTGNPTNWEWDFENDGIIDSYEQNPQWIYLETGTYSVSLTVSKGIYTDTKLIENYIVVHQAQTPYLISLTPGIEEISLEWDVIPENKTGHFNFVGGGMGPEWTIYIGGATINGTDMEAGDEIGIFDGDLLVGAFTLNQVCTPDNQFENAMGAYRTLVSGPGYQPGNIFTMVAWDESAQIESTSFEYTFSDPYGGAWTGDVFPDGDGQYSMAEFAFYVPTYNIYYEDGTLVAGEVEGSTYTDMDLTAGQEYCYFITQILANGEESNPSNVLCATPLFDDEPVLVNAIPGIEEISLEWEAIHENKTGHFLLEGASGGEKWTIFIGGTTFNGIYMVAGDEIGVFDGDLLVGAFTLDQVCTPENQFENDMIAFSVLQYGPGYQAGNTFTMVAWDESAQIESTSFDYTFSNPYGDAWTGDVFPYGDGQYSLAEFAFTCYVPIFNVYYEDGTLVAGEVEGTTYTDMELTAGQEYCYFVTQILENGEESDPSNVLCATPLYDNAPILVSATPGIEEINLEWAEISNKSEKDNKTSHFNYQGPGTSLYVWALYIGAATFNGIDMESGDEIGVFDGEVLVGTYTLDQVCTPDNQFDNDMFAYCCIYYTGDTIYMPGNAFTMVAWDESEQIESTSFEYTISDVYAGSYTGDVFPYEDGEITMAEFSFSGNYVPIFNIYYEDGTLVAGEVEGTTFTDFDLTAGQEYCYYVTQILESGEESDPSNVLCATPLYENAPVLVNAIPGIEEISLEWEAIPENDKTSHNDSGNDGEHWDEVIGTPTAITWSIYIGGADFNVDVYDLEDRDEIAIFDGDLLVGSFTLTQICTPDNQFDNLLIAYSELSNGPGFTPGNPFIFKAWDQSENLESTIFEYTFGGNTGDVFPDSSIYTLATLSFSVGDPQDLFNIYYEDGTLVSGEVEGTTYTDLDLTAGQEYCYYVTQILESGEESYPSNILCATPLYDNAPVLVSATPGIEEISLEWEALSKNKTGHFQLEGGSGEVWTIYIGGATFDGIDMEANDEIGVFDGDLLVGVFTLTHVCTPANQFENCMPAFTEIGYGPGYQAGNTFTMVAWDESAQMESISFEYTFSNPYGGAWTGDVFPDGDGQYSMAEFAFINGNYIPTFNIYYEDGTLVASEVEGTTYTDMDLTAGQEYCYYMTQILQNGEESNISNVLCATPTGNLGIVAGTISNGVYPIEGAVITLEGTIYTAISGADGTYAIEDVEPGTYDVTVSAEGYISQTKYDQIITWEETIIVDFSLLAIQINNLAPGFQFVSSRIILEDPDMLVVVEEILNENLDFVRNSQGQVLRKIGPNWVNGIGDWIVDEGYLFKMFSSDSFTINGALVDPATPIPVETGFQFVSYFPETPMDAFIAFATIIGDNLDFVRNSNGQTLRKIGPNWVNGLGDCQPSDGYLVKMYAADVLIYPCSYSITCGDPFTDLRDGQIYNTVQIGDQCWMAENMNIGTMIYSTEEMTDNGIIEKYCYNNNPANCEIYGGLYQWNEMTGYCATAGVQGICPSDWHLPTDEEWTIITDFLGGELVAGGKMKEIGTTHWNPPNTAATNESGLTTLPGGYLNSNGSFLNLGNYGYWLSSTELSSSNAWRRSMTYYFGLVYRNGGNKADGFSVRCIRDNSKIHTDGQSPFDNLSIRNNNSSNELSDPKRKNDEAIHFEFKGGNPAEAVYSIYIEGLKIGDEVAAFDGNKMIGSIKINSQNAFENELPIFSTLINGKGYEEGNPINLKVWSGNNIVSVDFTMEAIHNSYVSDVYPEGDGKYSVVNITKRGSVENNKIIVYPNPANENIFIVSPYEIFEVAILNGFGQSVYESQINDTNIQINTSNFESGIYIIRIKTINGLKTQKLIIK
jgi:uncharacterized protein (TIGR02145 family)